MTLIFIFFINNLPMFKSKPEREIRCSYANAAESPIDRFVVSYVRVQARRVTSCGQPEQGVTAAAAVRT